MEKVLYKDWDLSGNSTREITHKWSTMKKPEMGKG